ncbi:MAG: uroporphyrinogen decarboxylase family protein [Sedimentisphaeraceae bacterium JB056]
MNNKERFIAAVERKEIDRPASWLGVPHAEAEGMLLKHFKVNTINELIIALDDDVVPVSLPYHSPVSDAIYAAFDFAKTGDVDNEHRTLTTEGYFADITDADKAADFDWPDPELYIDTDLCRRAVSNVPQGRAVMGVIWSAHFQDSCSAFGMEKALMAMYNYPELYKEVIGRIVDFYLKANEIYYESTKGKLDAVLIGNDFGSQLSLMVSPDMLRKFVFDGTKKLVDQAHSYGLKVVHHSCGSIRDIIPDLINIGVDVIHPIQALAAGMEPAGLKNDFGDKVSFCGGVDAQQLLVNGSPEEVSQKVRELADIFPTGLVISPSHEAILPDISPANIEAIYTTLNSL